MTLTIKQQLILLTDKGATYGLTWNYFKSFLKYYQASDRLALAECQQLYNETVANSPQLKDKQLDLTAYDLSTGLLEKLAAQSFMIGDAIYPELWLQLPQPPLVIFYEGHLECLQQPLVSLVGTRQISYYGREMTSQMASAIALEGWCCVSGLALGVDRVVHESAAKVRHRSTIGIIATGTDLYYPKANTYLQQQMASHHLLLSEYLPHKRAQRHHYIMRNRLVAGISSATLVMEAAYKSGSLITANYAVQSNREVFSLPGRITDTHSEGCNDLIQHGAIPIVSISQTIEQLKQIFAYQNS